ncbi:MAG: Crp/Fnr family transcriptional regulator [Bacteroidetes bacterium]|nr:Crp/Fnr family transcriptional regulator [Bacteroidota bacterium]
MFEFLFENLSKTIFLSESDKKIISQNFKQKKLLKRQFFLQEGNISFHTGFVTKGCLKTYTIDNNGNELIYQISIEGWWVTDLFSFLTGLPAMYNIEAIENCEMLIMDLANREEIFKNVPQFERYMRLMLENNYIANQRRLNSMLGGTAEERYLTFTNKYPEISNRVPLKTIASYLGIAPESLSRIRRNIK